VAVGARERAPVLQRAVGLATRRVLPMAARARVVRFSLREARLGALAVAALAPEARTSVGARQRAERAVPAGRGERERQPSGRRRAHERRHEQGPRSQHVGSRAFARAPSPPPPSVARRARATRARSPRGPPRRSRALCAAHAALAPRLFLGPTSVRSVAFATTSPAASLMVTSTSYSVRALVLGTGLSPFAVIVPRAFFR
jgi:hypothetical protein